MLGVLWLPGCGAKEADATPAETATTNDQALQDRIAELESQVADLTAAADDAAAVRYAIGVNALLTLSGDTASPQGELIFTAAPQWRRPP